MMNISPKCAVELLEVIKYLDSEIKENISKEMIQYLNNIKDDEYYFQIDKDKNLFENEFMDETIDVLMMLFS